MRIETTGDYAWRTDLYDEAGKALGENTRSKAIDGVCEFTCQMLPALVKAAEHPDMTEDLATVLSTSAVKIEYRVESGVNVE